MVLCCICTGYCYFINRNAFQIEGEYILEKSYEFGDSIRKRIIINLFFDKLFFVNEILNGTESRIR